MFLFTCYIKYITLAKFLTLVYGSVYKSLYLISVLLSTKRLSMHAPPPYLAFRIYDMCDVYRVELEVADKSEETFPHHIKV